MSSRRYLYTSPFFSLFSLFHVHAGAIHSFYFRRSSSTNLYPQITTDPPRILHPPVTSLLGGSIRQTLCKKIDHSTLDSVENGEKNQLGEPKKGKPSLSVVARTEEEENTERKGFTSVFILDDERSTNGGRSRCCSTADGGTFLLHTSFFVRKLLINTVRDAS